jgi:hypothetical protein
MVWIVGIPLTVHISLIIPHTLSLFFPFSMHNPPSSLSLHSPPVHSPLLPVPLSMSPNTLISSLPSHPEISPLIFCLYPHP